MIMLLRIIIAIFLFTISACAPTKKEVSIAPPPQPQPQKPKELLISVSDLIPAVEKRIETLNLLLQSPDISEEQKTEIRHVINTYTIIKEMGAKGYINQNETKKLLGLLIRSFQEVEGRYVAVLQQKPVNISKIIEELAQKREKILQDYKDGKYTDVVNQCLELKLKYGGYAIGPDLETIFALSLGQIGMIREAIDTGEKVLQEMAMLPEKDLLKEKLTEWKKSLEEAAVPPEEKKAAPEQGEEKLDINLIVTNAKRLIEQENFEQALAILNESKIENNKEIDELKNKAVEGIINRERNEAAKLFLLAKESKEPDKKREYLEAAYRILEALVVQYPNSPLMDRIKQNLNKVSEELKNLTPPPSTVSQ